MSAGETGSQAIRRGSWAAWLCGLAAFAAAAWLGWRIDTLSAWSPAAYTISGRAILAVSGKADLSLLFAAYPPIPFLFTTLIDPLARFVHLDTLGAGSALLAGGFIATYAVTLGRARYGLFAVLALVVLLAFHPLMVGAVARGPQTMLLIWSLWFYGLGLFSFRANGNVRGLLLLALSLPLMAFSSPEGAVLAIAAAPFLLLAVPPNLMQRAYGSVYAVLLFPLIFSFFSMAVISGIFLHDPFAFIPPRMLAWQTWYGGEWWVAAAYTLGAVVGVMMIVLGLILRASHRRPLQDPAAALLGTVALGSVLLVLTGIAQTLTNALMTCAAATAVVVVRWPSEPGRFVRTAILSVIGLLMAGAVVVNDPVPHPHGVGYILYGQPEIPQGEEAVGRFIEDKSNVMIDADRHPSIVSARGHAEGLVPAKLPAFKVATLKRRVDADHVVVRKHQPGESDDAISQVLPDFYERGAPGYRISFDQDGWRVWSKQQPRMVLAKGREG